MKKLILFLLIPLSVFSQKTTMSFDSNALGESREITIGLPPSFEKNPNKKYPLLILLDGEYLFDPFYGALNYGAYWDDLPETIIVAISQNKKNERATDSGFKSENGLPSETGANFFEFIGSELIPFIEKKYRIAPFSIIAGHDVTAGFLNFFLYKENPIFRGYISMSPEFATDMETRIPEKLAAIKQSVYYYQSNGDGDIKKLQEAIKKLDTNIKLLKNPLVNYKFDDFKGASHYSLVLHSIPNALYQIFDSYKPISSAEYSEKIAVLQSGYVDYLVNRYDNLSKNLGINIPIRINDFIAIEAAILKNKAYPELDKLAELAKKNYPKSMLADYELGLMYEKMGDLKKALKSYQKASQLDEIGNLTKDMMMEKYDDMKSQTAKK
ncbi:alpha/beta hydrolase-fold protein [Flavobacterium caseinilyticum]|uniref:Alpha/beta hydrolase n=1 Tax=Flavobacterium caseinilyticum TaxID=2541732 RepID=A0A4R5AZ54_9FLAO|nr:alpha/beta hydrolase-fold protein [Flavobacterium caseinilyticum]TDD78093.1 alpha/beta hydrolase [Flavobacterium caseinilyticum]